MQLFTLIFWLITKVAKVVVVVVLFRCPHIGVTRCRSGLAATPEARWQRTGKPAELSPKLLIEQPKQLGVVHKLHNQGGRALSK